MGLIGPHFTPQAEHDPLHESFSAAVIACNPDYEPIEGSVIYYDPYRDYSKFKVPEMAKHFGYAYQKEARIVFRPKRKPMAPLKPVFLSIGPMADYADMVML